jgi:hypothetical protein
LKTWNLREISRNLRDLKDSTDWQGTTQNLRGKNSELPGTIRKTRKDSRVLRLFVAGIDFVLVKI